MTRCSAPSCRCEAPCSLWEAPDGGRGAFADLVVAGEPILSAFDGPAVGWRWRVVSPGLAVAEVLDDQGIWSEVATSDGAVVARW